MNKAYQHIRDRIRNIQFGILRCRDNEMNQSWQVKASPAEGNVLHIVLADEGLLPELLDRDVNLIQKYKDDYLYISGKVSAGVQNHIPVISVRIAKACWFEKKSRGSVTWLKEKYIYEDAALGVPAA